MPIISKETWDKFTQEEKERIRKEFALLKETEGEDLLHRVTELMVLFPEEALQPQPLTYEDVARELFSEDKGNAVFYLNQYGEITDSNVGLADNLTNDPTNCTSHKQAEKLLAINKLLNVAAFLNGKDWKPDWENQDEKKWGIDLTEGEITVTHTRTYQTSIVYFRTEELAEQAIQILGEDTVRLALTTEY